MEELTYRCGYKKCDGVKTRSSSTSDDACIRGLRFMIAITPAIKVSNVSKSSILSPMTDLINFFVMPIIRSHTPPALPQEAGPNCQSIPFFY